MSTVDLAQADRLVTRYVRDGDTLYIQITQDNVVLAEVQCINNLNRQSPPSEFQAVQAALLQNYLYKPDVPSSDVWDDLRFPAQGINPAGLAAPPTVDATVYPGTLLFPTSIPTIIAGVAQMPHGWVLGSTVHPHVHWAKTTSAAGAVVWEFRYVAVNIRGVIGAYSNWEACTYTVPDENTANKHSLADWSYLDMTGLVESAMILWQVRRNTAATADTYAADARLLEFDIHYRSNRLGSVTEIPV